MKAARPDGPRGGARRATPEQALWHIARGEALRLPAAAAPRLLRLRDGQLWVTADGRADAPPPEDWWLAPGESLHVPPGMPLLASGWPVASFELLEEPAGA